MLCMSGFVYVRGMNLLVWEHAEARSCHLDVLHSSFSTFSSEPRSLRDLGLTSLPRLVLTHQHWHQLQPCPALHFGSRHSNLGHPCLHNKHFNPQSSFQPQNQSNKIQWILHRIQGVHLWRIFTNAFQSGAKPEQFRLEWLIFLQ